MPPTPPNMGLFNPKKIPTTKLFKVEIYDIRLTFVIYIVVYVG